ncbi:hypothetical protein T069G_06929 [Trichoderma breve]|uniref:Uncharacterized protein n=1 Tax=Trichoderma breve TaxID=2034170 RepID=A0A9W9B9Y0_9HYPO|nr:hypothetical protein T069G_06929 [Trichoderma breve]KAJ4858662.1 hypothetical protein T069G_06929 [Trichoderma breve]
MADDMQTNDHLILDEESAPRTASRASDISSLQDTMDLDDAVATVPKSSRRKTAGAKKATEITEDQEDDSQEQLVMNLLDMVADATPDELATRQEKITSTLFRLKELQDQQPPKVSFNPSIANSRRERLEGMLIYLTSELSAIPASNWASYKKKLFKFCESESMINMEFPQRLLKVTEIIYLPEELEAIPREEFGRMHSVARVCATAAQAMGPDGENTDGLAEKWISAKVQDLEFLKRMFSSMRNTFRASGLENSRMPWETRD